MVVTLLGCGGVVGLLAGLEPGERARNEEECFLYLSGIIKNRGSYIILVYMAKFSKACR